MFMELDRFHQSITASLQGLYILVRPGPVIEVAAELRETAIDGFVGRGTTIPNVVHEVVSRNQVSVAAGEREQDLKYFWLRAFFPIATTQNAVPRKHLPLPNSESFEEIFFCRHYRDFIRITDLHIECYIVTMVTM